MERISLETVRRAARSAEAVCVLAPVPDGESPGDGYLRRIQAIDETALDPFVRIYLMGDRPDLRRIRAEKRDDRHYFLQFDSGSAWQRRRIYSLIRRCGRVYIHSVYRFVAGQVSPKLLGVLDLPGVKRVWDVHGAVPEEIEMTGDLPIAGRAAAVEEALYRKSDTIVCVTRAMEAHLRAKYGDTAARVLHLPIFDGAACDFPPAAAPGGKPTVVYAGGLQSWQCVDAMIELIDATWNRYDYRICTPDPDALLKRWGPGEGKAHIRITSVPPEEMDAAYEGCQYGLLLREESAVNAVACPTKLLEYVAHGIVPVLRSEKIGDIEALGIGFVRDADLMKGVLPTEAERWALAERNAAIRREEVAGAIRGTKDLFSTT